MATNTLFGDDRRTIKVII